MSNTNTKNWVNTPTNQLTEAAKSYVSENSNKSEKIKKNKPRKRKRPVRDDKNNSAKHNTDIDTSSVSSSGSTPCKVVINNESTLTSNSECNSENKHTQNELNPKDVFINKETTQTLTKINLKDNLNSDKAKMAQYNVPTKNTYNVLTQQNDDIEEESMDEDQDRTQNQQQHESTPRKSPPPIVLHTLIKSHSGLTGIIKKCVSGEFNIKYTKNNVNVSITNRDERKQFIKYLAEQNIDFHTYSDSTEKTHAFVVRGLTHDIAETDLAEELIQQHGLPVINCYKMKLKTDTTQTPNKALFLLITNNKVTLTALSAKIKYALHTRIFFERRRNNRRITQCHACQQWGHATANCYASKKCMFCAGKHDTKSCENKEQIKCANCGAKHQANNTSCTVYAQKLQWLENNAHQTINKPNSSQRYNYREEEYPAMYKPAPPPAQNAWKQRPMQTRQNAHPHQQQHQQTYQRPQHQQQQQTSQQQKQQRQQPPPTYTANPPTTFTHPADTFNELNAEFQILHTLVNIDGLLQAVKDLNQQLRACNSKQEILHTYMQFTKNIDQYDI